MLQREIISKADIPFIVKKTTQWVLPILDDLKSLPDDKALKIILPSSEENINATRIKEKACITCEHLTICPIIKLWVEDTECPMEALTFCCSEYLRQEIRDDS